MNSNQSSQYIGIYYAIPAIGGFHIEQNFGGPIPIVTDISAKDLDLTLALQLRINVKSFNDKLGIIKDASNNIVISSPLDISGGSFPTFISFNFIEFIQDIIIDNVISVGSFNTIYSDFRRDVINYYQLAKQVSVFDPSGESQYSGIGEFTKEDFVQLFSIDPSSNLYNDISGNMNIYYIPQLMKQLYENDPFNNRSNKTEEHGFLAGDIIMLENGISIRLDLINKPVIPLQSIDISNNEPMVVLSKIYTTPLVLHLDNL
jgi:hypothetical protein